MLFFLFYVLYNLVHKKWNVHAIQYHFLSYGYHYVGMVCRQQTIFLVVLLIQ